MKRYISPAQRWKEKMKREHGYVSMNLFIPAEVRPLIKLARAQLVAEYKLKKFKEALTKKEEKSNE